MYSEDQLQALKLKARKESWRRKKAHEWALDAGQLELRQSLLNSGPLSSAIWLWGRQRGKTFAAVYMAIETCLTNKNAIVRYCAKTKESALGIVLPTWEFIVSTLPDNWKPKKGKSEHEYIFPSTNSRFVIFGTDAQSFNKGRGPRSNLILLDECGFYGDLEKVESALLPSLQTVGGKVIYLSTPAETLAHPYNARIEAARQNNVLFHDTFYNNPRVDHDKVIQEESKRRGMTPEQFTASTYFKREYLAMQVQEETSSGMPDFAKAKESVIVNRAIPTYYDGYTSLDLGITNDPHFSLFGVHDWEKDVLYIVDELEMASGTNTIKQFTEAIKAKERSLFGTNFWNGTIIGSKDWAAEFGGFPEYIQEEIQHSAPRQPYLRVGDPAGGFLKDMASEYLLAVLPTEKTEKRLNADITNNMLLNKKILIHPRCVKLIEQLSGVAWDDKRRVWQHGIYVTGGSHHFDGVDCLIYMARNVRWSRKNQLPLSPEAQMNLKWMPEAAKPLQYQNKDTASQLKNIFNPPRRS